MELENIILSDVSQAQKAKHHLFSLICDYTPKTIAVILLDMGHTLRGGHPWEE
jgi:flagellar motor switch protein FliG